MKQLRLSRRNESTNAAANAGAGAGAAWVWGLVAVFAATGVATGMTGCDDDEPQDGELPPCAEADELEIRTKIDRTPLLELAATDLATHLGTKLVWTTGEEAEGAEKSNRYVVEIDYTTFLPWFDVATTEKFHLLGFQNERLQFRGQGFGASFAASTPRGAANAIYTVLDELGAKYPHPEADVMKSKSGLTLATCDGTSGSSEPSEPPEWYARLAAAVEALSARYGTDELVSPRFALRGFHEHTQHPIPLSDFYFRQDDPAFRNYLSNYLRWLARNRQNYAGFHMLKTVDLETWLPYIKDVVDEARGLGITMGLVASFADEQQNNFKLLDAKFGATTEEQIKNGLDALMSAGFGVVTFQIGTSEFTKPDDAEVLGWMNTAVAHLREKHPDVKPYAWIHTTCDLKADDGSDFFHLPGRADAGLGSWVHTTMFYNMSDAAPVYSCENFGNKLDYSREQNGKRKLVYFPETAWWLGFDNNMPLTLPVTGLSRQRDIEQNLKGLDFSGHITFTTGRDWGYWMYDHYLTQVTFDGSVTWESYVNEMLGGERAALAQAVNALTAIQDEAFLRASPELIFYLAGELQQDEIGEQAGILARRPKKSFKSILELDDAAFAAWQASDYAALVAMQADVAAAFEALDDTMAALEAAGEAFEEAGVSETEAEILRGLLLYRERIAHTLALYDGVVEARAWKAEVASAAAEEREPSETVKEAALAAATAKLDAAKAISATALGVIRAQEALYRYPDKVLIKEKPESFTSYKFGYLYETSSAFFWTRRDVQLESLIGNLFGTIEESWQSGAPGVLYVSRNSNTSLVKPDDPLANSVISSFVPQLLWGVAASDVAAGTATFVFAEDANENLLPDPESETVISDGVLTEDEFVGSARGFPLVVRTSTGEVIGTLLLIEPKFTVGLSSEGNEVKSLKDAELAARVKSRNLLDIIQVVGGVDDEAGTNLLEEIYGESPLPEELDFTFAFALRPPRKS